MESRLREHTTRIGTQFVNQTKEHTKERKGGRFSLSKRRSEKEGCTTSISSMMEWKYRPSAYDAQIREATNSCERKSRKDTRMKEGNGTRRKQEEGERSQNHFQRSFVTDSFLLSFS